ncbi:hypothetical protein [Ekhidna sp.]|uniref:hypothetical protein n=1 Tax=Ekhidna sp. TaxID=2608089 RepID=UPI0032970F9B
MNKTELITYLRNPNKLSKEQVGKLEEVVNAHPYFLSARLLLAKVSKEHNLPETKKRVASAAIYSTDRVLLKKYLSGNLFFLQEPAQAEESPKKESTQETTGKIPIHEKVEGKGSIENKKQPEATQPPKQTVSTPTTAEPTAEKDSKVPIKGATTKKEEKPISTDTEKESKPTPKQSEIVPPKKPIVETAKSASSIKSRDAKPQPEVPDLPSGELDSILEDLERDMENLKNSRAKFAEVQQKIEEDDAVSAAIQKARTEDSDKKKESPDETTTTIGSEADNDANQLEDKKDAPASEKDILEVEEAPIKEMPKEEATKEETVDEESRKAISDITQQVLEAAKKAKQEVAEEDKKELETAEKKEEEQEKEKDTPSKDDERAERVVREPRFSRFSSRSYLKPPEDIDPAAFLDDKKEEKPESKTTEEPKKEKESKITLPDLSKAKPVPRKNPRKSKSELKSSLVDTEAIDDKTSDTKEEILKNSESKKPEKEVEKKESTEKIESKQKPKKVAEEKPKKEKPATKKKTTEKKATAKKATEKKTTKAKASETKTTSKKKTATTKKETAKKTSKEKSTAKSTKKEDKKDDDKSDGKSQQDIIDKFIKESPSIKYQRKDDIRSEDLAEQSAAWDPNLASEYLAEIYLHQGNKKRAIEIYEALSLKYPEKKSYFADLISKIE